VKAEPGSAADPPRAGSPAPGEAAHPGGQPWAPWLLVGAVAAAWANALGGSFQFDDWNVIVHEPRVASLSAWWDSMPGIRPLLKLTYAANQASGLDVAGFHAVNVAVHAVNALLAWALLLRVGARASPAGNVATARTAALLGALLFALHPVQTEAVTYASGRSSSLAATFALASALAWMAGRDRSRPWLWAGLSPLLLGLSLLVKETAAVLPLALLLLEAVAGPRPLSWRRAARSVAPHVILLGAAAAAFLSSPTYRRMADRSLRLRDPWPNLLAHLDGLAWLTGQVVRIDRLNADPALPAVTSVTPVIALAAAALVAAAAIGIASLRRRPAIAFGLLWFLLWLPASGWWLPRPETASERQLYLAILGPAWLAGLALATWAGDRVLRRVAVTALVAALGAATVARNRVYADEVSFWEDVAAKAPHSPRAHNNLGFALAARCRIAEAEASFLRALEADPDHFRSAVNLEMLRKGLPLGPQGARCSPSGPPPGPAPP
jgi:hypothetical protein